MSDAVEVPQDMNIPHSRPSLTPQEAAAVASVMATGHIAQGPVMENFEQALALRIGRSQAIGTASGTAALHLVLLAMSIEAGDEVLIPSYVCTALLNAVHYVGANAVITDVDPATGNMDPFDARRRMTDNTRAIIVPHMFGCPAAMDELLALGVPIIEDCAQAIGATYDNRPVGSFGHAAVFSFYATKVMTTGEGGMVVSDSAELADRVRDLRDYDKRFAYRLRYNYKMTDLQAAMGLVQLSRLDEFVGQRRALAMNYRAAFDGSKFQVPAADEGHIYYRFVMGVPGDPAEWIRHLAVRGVTCARPVDPPLDVLLGRNDCPDARAAWQRHLSIPIYPSLTTTEQDRVIEGILAHSEVTR